MQIHENGCRWTTLVLPLLRCSQEAGMKAMLARLERGSCILSGSDFRWTVMLLAWLRQPPGFPPAWFLSLNNISGKRAGTTQESVDDLAKQPRAVMEIQSRLAQLALTVGAKELVAKMPVDAGRESLLRCLRIRIREMALPASSLKRGQRRAYQIRRWRGSWRTL